MDTKQREQFDRDLAASSRVVSRPRSPDQPPSWWRGDEEAAAASIAAARAMGLRVPQMGT